MIKKWHNWATNLAKSANYADSTFFRKYVRNMLVMTNYAKNYASTIYQNLSLNMINRTHINLTHITWIISFVFCLPCKADFRSELRFVVTSLLIVMGPCASGYNTSSFLTSRLFLISVIQPCTHLEFEFLASQILISQWTNTKGWSAINLKASVLNLALLTFIDLTTAVVLSTGQLKVESIKLLYLFIAIPCRKYKLFYHKSVPNIYISLLMIHQFP